MPCLLTPPVASYPHHRWYVTNGKKADSAASPAIRYLSSLRPALLQPASHGIVPKALSLVTTPPTEVAGISPEFFLMPGDYNVTEDQQAGWVQSFPDSGYYNIYLSDKCAYKYNFGNFRVSRASRAAVSLSSASVRPSRASEEYDDERNPTTDENGNVHYHTVIHLTPEMIAEEEEMYKRAPSSLRSKCDENPSSQGL
jgi:hypothetical protein